MKSRFALLLLIIIVTVLGLSCQKTQDSPTPVQIDSLKAALPKQIIETFTDNSSGQPVTNTYVVSIKYDTVNRTIQLYGDDTTNTNPYDVLAATYKYNSSGYLTGFIQSNINYGSRSAVNFSVAINRGADNLITNIVSVTEDGTGVDSTFYTYQSVNGNTTIFTYLRSYDNQVLSDTAAVTYYYSAANRLIRVDNDQGTYTYTYNANNSLQAFSLQGTGLSINGTYSYTSGLPDGKTDVFLQTLLGKDYYLLDLKQLDPYYLSVDADFENIGNSITDPYHVTGGTEQGTFSNIPVTSSATWTYQLNNLNNVTKLTFNGGTERHVYNLKY